MSKFLFHISKLKHSLFYILLLALPVQLGKHFFFDYSSILGIRVDYLAPTIYFTDILAIIFIFTQIKKVYKQISLIMIISVLYYLINAIFIANKQIVSLYEWTKLIEMMFLGVSIYSFQPKRKWMAVSLSGAIMYSSIIAMLQVVFQHSIGGILWWIGERSFYASTPGIATTSLGGSLVLRGYGTFAHPNVLAGFLVISLTYICWYMYTQWLNTSTLLKAWFVNAIIFGIIGLVLSMSRSGLILALCIGTIPFIKKISTFKSFIHCFIGVSIVLSIILPLYVPEMFRGADQHIGDRLILMETAQKIFLAHPFFGVGTGNFVVVLPRYMQVIPRILFQPVHNIYALVLSETGLVGSLFFLGGIFCILANSIRRPSVGTLLWTECLLLGLTDHYLLTLQQGLLMFTVSASLAFLGDNS